MRQGWKRARFSVLGMALAGLLSPAPDLSAAEGQLLFDTPEAAFAGLLQALERQDDQAVLAILGAEHEDQIFGQDRDAAHEEQLAFVARAKEALELRADGADRRIAHIGPRSWPLPIPIVREGGGWRFDTEQGIDELVNRRIGGNELSAIRTARAYVEVQREYAGEDRDGDQVLEYAQRVRSEPGRRDGLYWPTGAGEEPSPVGPLIADAIESSDPGDAYDGYFFRILTRQGANPPGGAYDYVINGNMIAGFALVSWPAEYGNSGVMTFVVNHQGTVFEKDLGPATADIVRAMQAYDPDATWNEVTD